MHKSVLSPWPLYTDKEIQTVQAVLSSGMVNYRVAIEGAAFEKEFADYHQCQYAVAMSNGTVALDAALKVLDIGFGDEVIVTPRTFIASASCIAYAGATPIFADVDLDSQNITAETIEPHITDKTKAIICVHHAGWPCDMDPILELAKQHNLKIIEDCAQAHGAKYNNKFVGTIGDIGCFSFCQDKIMTTGGEGGMITTNNKSYYEKLWSLKDHGKSLKRKQEEGEWFHDSIGTNYRLTEMQSAIGRLQLQRLSEMRLNREKNALAINEVCALFECIRTPKIPTNIQHAYYKHYVFIQPEDLNQGWTRNRIMDEINERGVPCAIGSPSDIYNEECFVSLNSEPMADLQNALILQETALMFLVHPTITDNELGLMCETIRSVLKRASKG